MYRHSGVTFDRIEYGFSPGLREVEDVPISIRSTRHLRATWHYEASQLVESRLTSSAGRLSGTITHHLPVPVTDWILAYGKRLYFPSRSGSRGDVAVWQPGVPLSLNDVDVADNNLKQTLSGIRFKEEKGSGAGGDRFVSEQTAYDVFSTNPQYFIRMLTFHRAVDGSDYTHLNNHLLQSFDLSPLLDLNRAVLIGRIRRPAATLMNLSAGKSSPGDAIEPKRRDTFVRIVFSVRNQETVQPQRSIPFPALPRINTPTKRTPARAKRPGNLSTANQNMSSFDLKPLSNRERGVRNHPPVWPLKSES
ncbi:MAG: hypothetical protein IID45_10370 [Planctomycetes bacterium]|nr:hypothetical protein [Planctomycetota bacterium]